MQNAQTYHYERMFSVSNLKKWAFNAKFIGVMLVVALVLYVVGAIQHNWWPMDSLPEQATAQQDEPTVSEGASEEKAPAPAGPPAGTLTANPMTIQHGQTVTLSWDTANLEKVVLEVAEGDMSAVHPSGNEELKPDKTTTYRLTGIAILDGNEFERSVEVKVIPPLPNPVKDLRDKAYSDHAEYNGASYQLNLMWDSYCNASVWRELSTERYDSELMQTMYGDVTRREKIMELAEQLYGEASKDYRELLSEFRNNDTTYFMAKGDFVAEEAERCEQPYSYVFLRKDSWALDRMYN